MANGLRDAGMLSAEDLAWVVRENAAAEARYTDPSTVVTDCYRRDVNPGARSWFKSSAEDLLENAHGYTDLLDRYRVPWVELRTERPGRIVYEDVVQVVAVPFTHEEHWPWRTAGSVL